MKEEKGKRKGIPISKAEEMPQGLFIILLSRTFKFMKKKLFLAGATLLLAAAAVTGLAAYDKSSMSELMNANVEALARHEGDKNGALWSNEAGTVYCCGEGNVRNCNESGIPYC